VIARHRRKSENKPIFTTEARRHGEKQNQPQITQIGADQKKRFLGRLNLRKNPQFILSICVHLRNQRQKLFAFLRVRGEDWFLILANPR
jgi:hypothetical protein